MPPRLRALSRASESGSPVTLHYSAGGEPPARLAVLPRLLYQAWDKGYLEAECLHSGLLKTYRLDRVQRVEAAT